MNGKKIFGISVLLIFLMLLFIWSFVFKQTKSVYVEKVLSPVQFILRNGDVHTIKGYEFFDDDYTLKNQRFAEKLSITEDEAFVLGNFSKYWAKNLIEGRNVIIDNEHFIYYKFDYVTKFKNSAFCIENEKPANAYRFNQQLSDIRRGKFVILDLDSDISYPISKNNRKKVKNYIVVRKSHIKHITKSKNKTAVYDILFNPVFKNDDYKIIVSDLTSKLKPDRNCSSEICKEILSNINKSKYTIDMAIYGYSATPDIEKALINAQNRGVKIRLIYDEDSRGNNIYPDTSKLLKIITSSKSDKLSKDVRYTMHNKFYIFDKNIVITGSANLSHTDMSGYNSNSIIVLTSPKIAEFYTQEFEQMYSGKFHNDKISVLDKKDKNVALFFSPQDKGITNGVLPLIKNAKSYIYIPSFVITEKRITSELINAKNRGVDIKIIVDALNASTQHSKHKELRNANILVKSENYAGKMHSKTMIIDDKYLIIGSMNFSNSGENRNDENMIVLEDSKAAEYYKKFFLYQWNRIPDKWLKYTPRAEGKDSIGSCSDGIDNNYDGFTDKEDVACK